MHSIFTQKISFIKVVTFAVLLFFAASAKSKFADFCYLLKSAKNENPDLSFLRGFEPGIH